MPPGILACFFVFIALLEEVFQITELTPGELMKIHRIRKGISQEALAEEMGSYQVRISRVESGSEIPSKSELELIEQILGVEIWGKERRGENGSDN